MVSKSFTGGFQIPSKNCHWHTEVDMYFKNKNLKYTLSRLLRAVALHVDPNYGRRKLRQLREAIGNIVLRFHPQIRSRSNCLNNAVYPQSILIIYKAYL